MMQSNNNGKATCLTESASNVEYVNNPYIFAEERDNNNLPDDGCAAVYEDMP